MRAETRLETLQENLSSLQHDNINLKEQLDGWRVKELGRDKGDSQDKFTLILTSLREDHEKVSHIQPPCISQCVGCKTELTLLNTCWLKTKC